MLKSLKSKLMVPQAELVKDETTDGQDEIILEDFLKWIWNSTVKTAFSQLADDPGSGRILWVPTGLLTLAPINAVEDNSPGSRDNTMSRCVSSYMVSLRALHHARQRPSVPHSALDILLVTIARAEGHASLNTTHEEHTIKESFGNSVKHLTQPPTSDILKTLSNCSYAHFACHGASDPIDPSNGGLPLGQLGGEFGRLTILGLDKLKLPLAEVVYLSACSTAELSPNVLLDENIPPANSFRMAGFRNVIGTLWSVHDTIARQIARMFHRRLGELRRRRQGAEISVAGLLHEAVLERRRNSKANNENLYAWTPFKCIGV